MIENVLEIKDTQVREVMTPLVDVVAIDAIATLIDFKKLWETHQYSRYCQLLLLRVFSSLIADICCYLLFPEFLYLRSA